MIRIFTEFGVMKAVAVLAILTAVLVCIRAAPVTCSNCSIAPVSPTGPCAYCLEPMDTSLEDGGMKALFDTLFNSQNDLDDLSETVSICIYLTKCMYKYNPCFYLICRFVEMIMK